MKNKFNFKAMLHIAIIAVIAIIGFSMTACGEDEGEDITITITGLDNSFNGWKASISFTDVGQKTALTYANYVNITSSTSVTLSILDKSTDKPFNKAGNYDLVLWFEKSGENDRNYYKGNHALKLERIQ